MDPERWLPISGWEDSYEVSSHGRVRRMKVASGTRAGRLLACHAGQRGYPVAHLFDRVKRSRPRYVHALVMEAFVGSRPAGMCVNHIDFVRRNNRLENLEYVTPKENTQHSKRAGRLRGGAPKADNSPMAKLTLAEMLDVRERWGAGQATQKELGDEYGVTRQAIWRIVHGFTWRSIPIGAGAENG
jgi:hypothetical protein